jgi:hypothetical protein
MKTLLFVVIFVMALLSFRGVRWAYISFIVLGLLYFPLAVGFHLNPQPCELTPSLSLALYSFSNYPHIVLLTLFFVMTSRQISMSHWSGFVWAGVATVVMGALVELAEGIAGKGHCRLRDLIPDATGAVIGAVLVMLWRVGSRQLRIRSSRH